MNEYTYAKRWVERADKENEGNKRTVADKAHTAERQQKSALGHNAAKRQNQSVIEKSEDDKS